MIAAGTILQNRYRIDRQIGQGGMGSVYVATDDRFASTVAIKETLTMDDNFRKAIEREARLLNSLKHNALPRVSDHFEENDSLFLVMEYIPGEDLSTILESDKQPFAIADVLKWADQLLEALDFLHNQEMPVIHRDIKPQNLKLNASGQIILLDFGLAKGNPTDAGSHQTAAKSIFGYSRSYASLEQIQGTGTDPRSDLYSLAATLYHLITGVPPDDALTRAMSVLSQKADPLRPANYLRDEIPRGFAGVLQRAMDLNAGERPASASEMRQMLRESENYAFLADETTLVGDRVADAQIFAQTTKIMPMGTQVDPTKETDLKTELMPTYNSEETEIRPAVAVRGPVSEITSDRPRRKFVPAMAALGVLLVGALAAGTTYVVKPSVFGIATAENSTDRPSSLPASNTGGGNSVDVRGTEFTANANSQTPQTPDVPADTRAVTDRTRTEVLANKPAAETKPGKAVSVETGGDEGEDVQIQMPKGDEDGPIIFTETKNGKRTITTIRDGEMPSVQEQIVVPGKRIPRGVRPENLNPQQLRRLQRIVRDQKIVIPPIPPEN